MQAANTPWQQRLYRIIYNDDTLAGRAFDIALLLCIVASILVVMLDSIPRLHALHGEAFFTLEWAFTALLYPRVCFAPHCHSKTLAIHYLLVRHD